MRLVVFGASGRVGRLVVDEALRRGHSVTAFVHSHNPLDSDPNLTIVKGDVHDADTMRTALTDGDVVISTLGSWRTKEKNTLSTAMKRLIPIMEKNGPHRLVSLTGSAIPLDGDHPRIVARGTCRLFGLFAPRIQRDGIQHLALLQASSLDWTVVRASAMTNGPKHSYRLTDRFPAPWQTIPRHAVARCLIDIAESPVLHLRESPYIVR